MARDPVLLNKAMEVWKELVMSTGFERLRLEFEDTEEMIAEWAPQFNSKKPPTKEEIDFFCSKVFKLLLKLFSTTVKTVFIFYISYS